MEDSDGRECVVKREPVGWGLTAEEDEGGDEDADGEDEECVYRHADERHAAGVRDETKDCGGLG